MGLHYIAKYKIRLEEHYIAKYKIRMEEHYIAKYKSQLYLKDCLFLGSASLRCCILRLWSMRRGSRRVDAQSQ